MRRTLRRTGMAGECKKSMSLLSIYIKAVPEKNGFCFRYQCNNLRYILTIKAKKTQKIFIVKIPTFIVKMIIFAENPFCAANSIYTFAA